MLDGVRCTQNTRQEVIQGTSFHLVLERDARELPHGVWYLDRPLPHDDPLSRVIDHTGEWLIRDHNLVPKGPLGRRAAHRNARDLQDLEVSFTLGSCERGYIGRAGEQEATWTWRKRAEVSHHNCTPDSSHVPHEAVVRQVVVLLCGEDETCQFGRGPLFHPCRAKSTLGLTSWLTKDELHWVRGKTPHLKMVPPPLTTDTEGQPLPLSPLNRNPP